MPALLEVRELTRRFGEIEALRGITAVFPEGAIGLIGPNGAGKTTLLRLLMGLIAPSSGSVQVLGFDAGRDGLRIRERIGYMPEFDCLIPSMTGIGFVAYMGRVSGLPKEVAFQRAHEVLQLVGFREERYRAISEYSVGMRQRVKLAQALVHDPPLVVLDEPTAGLDPMGRDAMLNFLGYLARRPGRSMVLSTHLLGDIERVCDQVLMLNAGRRLAAGRLDELRVPAKPELAIRVKGPTEAFAAALARRGIVARAGRWELRIDTPPDGGRAVFEAALEAGVQVRQMLPAVRTVEDLFLQLVPAGEAAR